MNCSDKSGTSNYVLILERIFVGNIKLKINCSLVCGNYDAAVDANVLYITSYQFLSEYKYNLQLYLEAQQPLRLIIFYGNGALLDK